jgi:2-keto-4-pentenoate hydratase/2-oxohepta-3-ene-1,7-dioic acid hydratase in catechol pathway
MPRRFARLALADGRASHVELRAGSALLLDGPPWAGGRPTGEQIAGVGADGRGAATRPLCPVEPSKILCVGRNYRAHAAELGHPLPSEPLLFLKPASALLGPGGTIELPDPLLSSRIEHEVELGLVLGRRVRRATEQQARDAIFGYTVVGDITARDLQSKEQQWTRAKGMDGFCPVGPVVVSELSPARLGIRCLVNDELRQSASTRDMLFSPAAIVAYASQTMTLEPGDLVATGTPEGVGPLRDGDRLVLEIEGIGALCLHVQGFQGGASP